MSYTAIAFQASSPAPHLPRERRRSSVLGFADATGIESLFPGSAECIQITPGRFEAHATAAVTSCARVHTVAANRGIQLRARIGSSRTLIGFPNAPGGTVILESGNVWRNGGAIVVCEGNLDLSVLGPAEITWVDFDLDALASKISASGTLPVADIDLGPSPCALATLRRFASAALAGVPGPSLHETAAALARVSSFCARPKTPAELRRFALVRAVEAFYSECEMPPSLREICAAVNCKLRALMYSFVLTYGLSPAQYFKVRRLNAVRRELRRRAHANIFDVAADHGFWHMGHFGADYKAMFGSTPSQTRAEV